MGSATAERRSEGRWRVVARRGGLSAGGLFASYVALVLHPQPLFAYSQQRGNVVLYARSPLPPRSSALLDDVQSRISTSAIYDAEREHHVFLCDTPALFGLFTLWNYKSGGVTALWANSNVFIRPSRVERDRVIGASGVEKGGDRTLAYYIAHEVTHAMTADRIGRYACYQLAAFQREGYADYVAFARPVDVARGRRDLLADTVDMDPRRSGHYDRYRLLVGYLLQERHYSVDDLLGARLERSKVEAELRRAALLSEK